jgi:hypothetical protein
MTWWDTSVLPLVHAYTRIGHQRNNARTFTERMNFLLFLYLVFFCCGYFFFCFLIPILTPFVSLPFPVLQSIVLPPNYTFCLLIHYLPQFSPPPLNIPQPVTTPPSYTLTTHWLAYCSNCIRHSHLQSLTQAPSTATAEIYPNMQKGHKTHQSLYLFPHPSTPFPAPLFSATFTNYINFYI